MPPSKHKISALILTALLGTTVLTSPVSAEKGMSAYEHQHSESHTSTQESTTSHTQSSTTSTHSSSSISLDKTGTADVLGSLLLPNPHRKVPQLNSVSSRTSEPSTLFAVKAQNDKWGAVDVSGKTILEPRFQAVTISGNTLSAKEKKNSDSLYFSLEGQPLPSPKRSPGLYAFKEKGRWGFQDENGKTVLAPVYKNVLTEFHEGIAFVKDSKGKQAAIDEKGQVLFAAPYDEVFPFQNGLAEVRRHVKSLNWTNLILSSVLNYDPYNDGPLDLSWDGQKRGYIDTQGKEVIDSHNDAVYPMTPWGTFVKNKGKVSFVDRQGRILFGPGEYDIAGGSLDENAGLASLKEKSSGKYGIIDLADGTLRLPFAWDGITFLGNERFTEKKDGITQLIDESTGKVLHTWNQELTVTAFGPGAEVTWLKGTNWQIMDKNGNVLSQLPKGSLEQVQPFQGTISVVKSKGQWGLMDQNGHWLLQGMKKIQNL